MSISHGNPGLLASQGSFWDDKGMPCGNTSETLLDFFDIPHGPRAMRELDD
jgi:hypothetical protein